MNELQTFIILKYGIQRQWKMTGFIIFPPKQQKGNKVNRKRRMNGTQKEGDVMVSEAAFSV